MTELESIKINIEIMIKSSLGEKHPAVKDLIQKYNTICEDIISKDSSKDTKKFKKLLEDIMLELQDYSPLQ